ncbi:hypothetical protein C8J56DRAFT_884315 [Mycena floridula]|nr:hypothetical protein C8J56DRAFT_884315 [Mycena floridula]
MHIFGQLRYTDAIMLPFWFFDKIVTGSSTISRELSLSELLSSDGTSAGRSKENEHNSVFGHGSERPTILILVIQSALRLQRSTIPSNLHHESTWSSRRPEDSRVTDQKRIWLQRWKILTNLAVRKEKVALLSTMSYVKALQNHRVLAEELAEHGRSDKRIAWTLGLSGSSARDFRGPLRESCQNELERALQARWEPPQRMKCLNSGSGKVLSDDMGLWERCDGDSASELGSRETLVQKRRLRRLAPPNPRNSGMNISKPLYPTAAATLTFVGRSWHMQEPRADSTAVGILEERTFGDFFRRLSWVEGKEAIITILEGLDDSRSNWVQFPELPGSSGEESSKTGSKADMS